MKIAILTLYCVLIAPFFSPLLSKEGTDADLIRKDELSKTPIDEIHLVDGTVARGTVIRVLNDRVEYDPEGPLVYHEVPRNRVLKIIYADGKSAILGYDEITSSDRKTFRCTVVKVSGTQIICVPEGSMEEKTLERAAVRRIRFADGRTFPAERKSRESALGPGRGGPRQFRNAWVRVAHFAGTGMFRSGIEGKEQRILDGYRADLTHAYMFPRGYRLENLNLSGGADLDVYFPHVKFGKDPVSSRHGLKAGLRARWGYYSARSTLIGGAGPGRGERTVSRNQLTWGQHVSVGPVLNFTYNPPGKKHTLIMGLYATAGMVYMGALKPGAALHNSFQLIARLSGLYGYGPPFIFINDPRHVYLHLETANNTKVRGFTVRMGIGPEIAPGGRIPLVMGARFAPSYTRLVLGRTVPVFYDRKKIIHQWEIAWELTVGIHI